MRGLAVMSAADGVTYTGIAACRKTDSVTDPKNIFLTPPRPWVPSTTRSAVRVFAVDRIASAGGPVATTRSTALPTSITSPAPSDAGTMRFARFLDRVVGHERIGAGRDLDGRALAGDDPVARERALGPLGEHDAPLRDVAGVAFFANGSVVRTPSRPFIKALDHLPLPAWDLVDVEHYRSIWRKRHGYYAMNMATTRGCPYSCNWCAKPIYGQRYAVRAPEAVVNEIEWLFREYHPDQISIVDDVFGLQPGWVEAFAEHLAERVIGARLVHVAAADPDRANQLVLEHDRHAARDEVIREALLAAEIHAEQPSLHAREAFGDGAGGGARGRGPASSSREVSAPDGASRTTATSSPRSTIPARRSAIATNRGSRS